MANPKELLGDTCLEVLISRTRIWELKGQLEFISKVYLDADEFFNSFEENLEFILCMLKKDIQEIDDSLPKGWKLSDIEDDDLVVETIKEI